MNTDTPPDENLFESNNNSLVTTSPGNISTYGNYSPSAEQIVEAVILCAIFVVAIVGNFALWLVVCLSPALRTLSNALLLCLSTADVMVTLSNMPMTVYTILIGRWGFSDTLCIVQGYINMTTFIASVMSLAAISWNRYIAICKSTSFRHYFSRQNTAIIIATVWLVSLILASPPLLGWGMYAYLPRQSFCFCHWPSSISYTFFMVGTCFGIPCISMTVCYVGILREVRASRKRVGHFANANVSPSKTSYAKRQSNSSNFLSPGDTRGFMMKATNTPVSLKTSTLVQGTNTIKISIKSDNGTHENGKDDNIKKGLGVRNRRTTTVSQRQAQKRMREELRLVLSLLIVISIFIVAWLPFCVTMFWSVFAEANPPPRSVDMFTLLLGYANSCCNPIVYGLMNKRFNEAFKRLFRCQCGRVSRILPTDLTSTMG